MTFYEDKNQKNTIIKKYTNKDNYHIKEYLDGNISCYYCSDPLHKEDIINLMKIQALTRDKEQYKIIRTNFIKNYTLFLSTTLLSTVCLSKDIMELFCLAFLLGLIVCKNYRKNKSKLEELKKYRLYFKIEEYLKQNSYSLNEDNKLDITTLDNFSLDEIKKINYKIKIKKLFKVSY